MTEPAYSSTSIDTNFSNLPNLDWTEIDTVLLDMDGTLLDLNFDNHVWNNLFPAAYAQRIGETFAKAQQRLLQHMGEIRGTIQFYNFDYWTQFSGVDLVELHQRATDLIAWRPGALDFLEWLQSSGRTSVIATNAHRSSVDLKEEVADISSTVDAVVSCHDYGYPKEHPLFWQNLNDNHPFDPARTLFIDDNEPVLDAAKQAKIEHLLCVSEPDSNRPVRSDLSYPSFNDFNDLYA